MKRRADLARASQELLEEEEQTSSADTVSEEGEFHPVTGLVKCRQAYEDYRDAIEPLLTEQMRDPRTQFDFPDNGFKFRDHFFEVREAIDKVTRERRAMKIFRKTDLTADSIKMVKREIELLMNLDHPNLCRIYDLFEDIEKIYLLIDNFKGGTLFEHIVTTNCLKEQDTATIASQLVSVMCYLHKQGLVLRRLRPEIVVFGNKGSLQDLRLMDLMFCNFLDQVKYEPVTLMEDVYEKIPDNLY